MIESFVHKGLEKCYLDGVTKGIQATPNDYGNHKDRPAGETIALLKDILRNVGIGDSTPIVERRFNPMEGCHSIYIVDPSYPALASYGKGVTDEYSQASAYAEFVERLQCMYFHLFHCLGGIFPSEPLFHDQAEVAVADLMRESPGILREMLADVAALPVKTLPCLPFWDVSKGKTRQLPLNLLFLVTLTTGMSSGNTPEESLTQGVCEVMERYAARLVVQGELPTPTIPLDDLPVTAPGLKRVIDLLHSSGLKLIVKDCTMGGAIPVLAGIVVDEAGDRFCLCYGSDPVFDVALQRCITELYQGRHHLPHSYSFWQGDVAIPPDYFNNVYASLRHLLRDAPEAPYQNAFSVPGRTNKEYLAFVLDKVHAMDASVYVRDFSFLGFPSHYVYISGMSPPEKSSAEQTAFYFQGIDESLSIIFRLPEAEPHEIQRLAQLLADKYRSETPFSSLLLQSMENCFCRAPVVKWIEPRSFLAFLFIETGYLDDALRLLEEPKHVLDDPPEKDLWPILADYCRLEKRGVSDEEALSRLRTDHGDGPYGPSLPHLVTQNWASVYLKEPPDANGRKFLGLPIPRCDSPFSCQACSFNGRCLLGRFVEIRGKIATAYKPIDQSRLGAILTNGVPHSSMKPAR